MLNLLLYFYVKCQTQYLNSTMDSKLSNYGISAEKVHWNLSPEELVQISLDKNQVEKASSGAINVLTGKFTGRSPLDRFIVKDEVTENTVWWDGKINIPFDSDKFDKLYEKVTAYLSGKELFARDVFACADDRFKMKIRAVNEKRSEEHTSELQSRENLVCRLLLEKKKKKR